MNLIVVNITPMTCPIGGTHCIKVLPTGFKGRAEVTVCPYYAGRSMYGMVRCKWTMPEDKS